ncbi:phospholipid-transporting ATPase 1-like, partial [Trifolium medium]|nr:phospholipid-transporting ATPase 1-like [Trifolium medium]
NDNESNISIKHPTRSHLSVYSSQGFRTLEIASRDLSDAELLWQSMYEEVYLEGVPEAIESLLQAGVNVWILLTGDKQEAAISFSVSCKLLNANMQKIIKGTSEVECRNLLADAREKIGVRSSRGEHHNLKHKTNARHGDLDIPNDTKSSSIQVQVGI